MNKKVASLSMVFLALLAVAKMAFDASEHAPKLGELVILVLLTIVFIFPAIYIFARGTRSVLFRKIRP